MTNQLTKQVYRRRRIVVALVLILVLLGTIGYFNRSNLRTAFDSLLGRDYSGAGTGAVTLVITPGESGLGVASDLQKLGVVKNSDVVYRLIVADNTVFYPGSYSLRSHMSSQSALALLASPSALQVDRVTIREGLRISQVLQLLATATSKPLSDFESAAQDLAGLGIPTDAPNADGYLFPATYQFNPTDTPHQILKQMVDRCYQELDKYGVSVADRHRVLTLAAMIQKEARQTADFYKVSRVFTNRLNIGMHLQSDATVSYGTNGNTVSTTAAQRADNNGYNTYLNAGLPIGPIDSPGGLAIDAALHPTAGSWLYFCAVNLKTGETVFSTTAAGQAAAVAKWQAWMAANPGWNGN